MHKANLMPHFIVFQISTALNDDFHADCSDVLDFLLDFLFQSYEGFCVSFLYGV